MSGKIPTRFTTSDGRTILEPVFCSCSKFPLPHVFIFVDENSVSGPFFSRGALSTFAQGVLHEEALIDKEVPEVEEFFETLPLPPEAPLFDLAAQGTLLLDMDDNPFGDHIKRPTRSTKSTEGACFIICRNCGRHGYILDDEGAVVAFPRSKPEALRNLQDLIDYGDINPIDASKVEKEISNSTLPDKEEEDDNALAA